MVRRRKRGAVLVGKERVAAGFWVSGKVLSKNVGDGREAIVRLLGWDVVNVRVPGQIRGLVGDVSR